MPLKVVKFGGTSLADAAHFRQVASIIKSDLSRRFVVPSAPGKRFPEDTKITDLFYRCYDQIRSGRSIDVTYGEIVSRFNQIISDLGLDFDLSGEYEYIKNAMLHRSGGLRGQPRRIFVRPDSRQILRLFVY